MSVRDVLRLVQSEARGDDLREALARLANTVAIVACWHEGAPRGLLVSSLVGLSLEPPRLLFCVRKLTPAHEALVRAKTCGISILRSDQDDEARRFSHTSRARERFSSPQWKLRHGEPPLYSSALARISAELDQIIDAGSHSIIIVHARAVAAEPGSPLLYVNRAYTRLTDA